MLRRVGGGTSRRRELFQAPWLLEEGIGTCGVTHSKQSNWFEFLVTIDFFAPWYRKIEKHLVRLSHTISKENTTFRLDCPSHFQVCNRNEKMPTFYLLVLFPELSNIVFRKTADVMRRRSSNGYPAWAHSVQRISWSNMPPRLLTCTDFLYNVVLKKVQGEHHCTCAQKWLSVIFHIFHELSNKKKN